MTTKTNRIRLSLESAILVVLLFVFIWQATQPRYAGKTAPEWFQDALYGMRGSTSFHTELHDTVLLEKAAEAFRNMGHRGIRLLVDEYLQPTPVYVEWYDRLVASLQPVVSLPVRRMPNRFLEPVVARRLLLSIGHEAVPELIRSTRSRNAEVRAAAVAVLGELGPGNPQAQACLLRTMGDASIEVVCRSLEGFWMTMPEPATTIPLILPFLTHTNDRVRVEASYCVGCLAPIPEPGLATLVALLSDSDGTVRANAARAIGLSGVRSEPILASLVAQLDDSNGVTRFRAAEALARLWGRDATNRTPRLLPVAMEAFDSPRDYFRLIGFNARTAIGEEGLMSEAMMGTFRELYSSPMVYVRFEAVEALEFHWETHRVALPPSITPLLVSAQGDPNGLIRHRAAETLQQYP